MKNGRQEAPEIGAVGACPPGAFAAAAEDLWRRGLFPIPLGGHDGEEPLIRGFTKMRRPSLATVQRWAVRFPGANIGVVTGAVSQILVIVINSADPAILRAVEARFGQSPMIVRTPSGGWHLYYRFAGERCTNLRAEGLPVDIKGEGGYVVAPPSVRQSGENAGKAYSDPQAGGR
jgi:hypothetical protein